MNFLSGLRVVFEALLVNKARSALTSLGIVIGISAVIAMVSAGNSARAKLDERLDTLGKGLVIVRAGSRSHQGLVPDFVPLTQEDADALRKDLGDLVTGVCSTTTTQRVCSTRTGSHATAVVGTTADLWQVRNWALTSGRFFTEEDVKKQAPVCLIGRTVQKKLFPNQAEPIGALLRVDQLQLRIIGVLGEKGRTPLGADQDDQILLPLTTFQRRLMGDDKVGMILANARSEDLIDQTRDRVTEVLRRRHRLAAAAPNDFDVSSIREMAGLAAVLAATMQGLSAIIASISLLVGGIGIMNIMLVSVTERTREIGIRMAVGATPSAILTQFLAEAVVLCLIGGLLGVTLGVGAAVILSLATGWPVEISPWSIMVAFGVSAAVGIFFGYYPARKASRLDPIEALRYE